MKSWKLQKNYKKMPEGPNIPYLPRHSFVCLFVIFNFLKNVSTGVHNFLGYETTHKKNELFVAIGPGL